MSELDEIANMLRTLGGRDVAAKVASRAAVNIQLSLEKTLSAGSSPEGTPWEARKAGGRAYANAASRVETASHGNLVRVTLTGPEVYGHFGSRGMPVRQMIPDAGAGIPQSVVDAILKAAAQVIGEAV